MTRAEEIVQQLIKGYDKKLVDELHQIRIKEKTEKVNQEQRPKIYKDNIVIFEK